ncbi:ABC transporter permease [Nocardioides faecalis]|uniref:ABC transporter permease n=1 Tax=Nocardioides faecalis TaxID=2803858 RepID=UPI001965D8AC|nr:ABC transporter permease subunit [Nocardioides faecalis]
MATPRETVLALGDLVGDTEFWNAMLATIAVALVGLAAAMAAALVLGILIGWFPAVRRALRVPLEFLKPIPPIVVMPVAILILGPTTSMAVFLVFYGCFLMSVSQIASGVAETDPVAIDTARSYGFGRREVLTHVVLPSTLPFAATAFRITLPIALVASVIAGLLGGADGLGLAVNLATQGARTDLVFALVFVLGLLGLVFNAVGAQVERRLLHWHPSHREVLR